jgi:predicted GH43/DUF377 family glycosyl hydrolase
LYPAHDKNNKYEWDGGCEDPRVVEIPQSEGGGYLMTYTSYDGTARLCVATSQNLFEWKKHGPAFAKTQGGSYINAWTKSGSIVVDPQPDGRLVAAKINGLYWMYWGENELHIATSKNLIDWDPIMNDTPGGIYRGRPDHQDLPTNAKKPLSVLSPRKGHFDSNLVEPGPPALLRPDGILFIYNSKNTACYDLPGSLCINGEADTKLAPGTYSAGQVLFSREDPTVVLKRWLPLHPAPLIFLSYSSHTPLLSLLLSSHLALLLRSDEPFFKPTEPFEITGQVANVCFLEGLVYFKGRWFLYYGTADSKIAVGEATVYDYRGMLDLRAKARRDAAAAERNSASSGEEVFTHVAASEGASAGHAAPLEQDAPQASTDSVHPPTAPADEEL